MEYISFQQIRQIRDAGYHNRCQPNGIRSKIDIRNQVLVRQHRQYDTTDPDEADVRRILIVEDNVELLNLLAEIFSPLYQVYKATNGDDGFRPQR